MTRTKLILAAAALTLVGLGAAHRPAPADQGLSISSVAFMAGQWRNDSHDGLTEEHWSKPSGNNVMGMFRWLKPDGTPSLFEILTIVEQPDGVYLRLVHFDTKLDSRDAADGPMTLKLEEAGPAKAVFKAAATEKRLAGVTYESPTADALHITVFLADPAREPLKFQLKRTTVDGK